MNKNYFNSKKYIILLVVICILFIILVTKMFDYLPQPPENVDNYKGYIPNEYQQGMVKPNSERLNESEAKNNDTNDEDEDEDGDDDDSNEEEQKSGHIDFMPQSSNNMEFDEIPAPKGAVEEEINATN